MRARSGCLESLVRNSEPQRRRRSKEMKLNRPDQDYWTEVALGKRLRGKMTMRDCWSQAESVHGERWTGTRMDPRQIAVTFQV